MEVFVDFGLFELLVALGLSAVARAVYSHKLGGFVFLLASIALPAALIFVGRGETARWLAALTLVTALVNASIVVGAMQRGDVRTAKLPRLRWGHSRQEKQEREVESQAGRRQAPEERSEEGEGGAGPGCQ